MKIVETPNEPDHLYVPHLLTRELVLEAGKEWTPPAGGWTLLQAGNGAGYWLEGDARLELENGALLLLAGDTAGRILASCLNGLRLNYFTVVPERLPGLITQGEQDWFVQAAGRRELACRILPANSLEAAKMREFCRTPKPGLAFRLALLQLLVEVLGGELAPATDPLPADVKDRLRAFLQATPPAGLLEISFEELAQGIHCTPRHLSRVFYDVVGMSFRDKRAEIRLSLARELLATSQSKVVDVAFKSGYKSLSLFNRMFTRRFGISPGRWRQKNGDPRGLGGRRETKARLTVNPRFRRM